MIPDRMDIDVEELSADELAAALEAFDASCDYGAAIGLIIEQGSWLRKHEFRKAVQAWVDRDGRVVGRVDWEEVDVDGPASSGELRILEIARSLVGIPGTRSLRDLLNSLDDYNVARVLLAMEATARGWRS